MSCCTAPSPKRCAGNGSGSTPPRQASPPRVEPADIRPPSVEQVRRLLDVVCVEDIEFFTYLHLAVMTGARRSQLLAMRWSDIDFDHAAIGFASAGGGTGRTSPRPRTGAPTACADPVSVELLAAHCDRASARSGALIDGFVFSADSAGRRPSLREGRPGPRDRVRARPRPGSAPGNPAPVPRDHPTGGAHPGCRAARPAHEVRRRRRRVRRVGTRTDRVRARWVRRRRRGGRPLHVIVAKSRCSGRPAAVTPSSPAEMRPFSASHGGVAHEMWNRNHCRPGTGPASQSCQPGVRARAVSMTRSRNALRNLRQR